MFSHVDLVRVEIALDAEVRFDITIPEVETDDWRTLGDVARTVAGHAGGRTTEAEAFAWVRALMAEAYGVSMELTPEGDVFGDYDRVTAWFFARNRSDRRGPAELGDVGGGGGPDVPPEQSRH